MAVRPKNVILITIDSLRADHLGCLGYPKNTTPNLDTMAKDGVLFTRAISCGPDTPTSITPLLTSAYIRTHLTTKEKAGKLKTNIGEEPDVTGRVEEFKMIGTMTNEIYKTKTTLAQILKSHGYNTAAFHSNPFLSRYFSLGKEFDYFYDSFSYMGGSRKIKIGIREMLEKNTLIFSFIKNIYNRIQSDNTPYDRADTINKKAIAWLENQKENNFFAWIHYMDVHFPYKPLKNFQLYFRSKSINNLEMSNLNYKMTHRPEQISEDEFGDLIDLYDGGIRYVDNAIELLMKELEKMNLLKDTLIIITADHGDEFRDHGGFVHNAKLYDELIRVPLIIYNSAYRHIEIDEPVSLLDVSPTILDICGIPVHQSFQGKSLVPVIQGERVSSGVISESIGKGKIKISYRTKNWKYIFDDVTGKHELYNLNEDRKEKNNLCDKEKEKAKEFKLKIEGHISEQEKMLRIPDERERAKKRIRGLKNYVKT